MPSYLGFFPGNKVTEQRNGNLKLLRKLGEKRT